MRLWQNERPQSTPVTERDYETVGYVISGRAELDLEGQTYAWSRAIRGWCQPVPGTLTAY
jgi:hypothetical protein